MEIKRIEEKSASSRKINVDLTCLEGDVLMAIRNIYNISFRGMVIACLNKVLTSDSSITVDGVELKFTEKDLPLFYESLKAIINGDASKPVAEESKPQEAQVEQVKAEPQSDINDAASKLSNFGKKSADKAKRIQEQATEVVAKPEQEPEQVLESASVEVKKPTMRKAVAKPKRSAGTSTMSL